MRGIERGCSHFDANSKFDTLKKREEVIALMRKHTTTKRKRRKARKERTAKIGHSKKKETRSWQW